eukprot:GHVP01002332.1.p1 GENE.GHVP01002332.1~~GHVP01002332.1.p1  ORF type:complete len:462 (+),score=38.24 GHVP01002332.1:256-1641(+)
MTKPTPNEITNAFLSTLYNKKLEEKALVKHYLSKIKSETSLSFPANPSPILTPYLSIFSDLELLYINNPIKQIEQIINKIQQLKNISSIGMIKRTYLSDDFQNHVSLSVSYDDELLCSTNKSRQLDIYDINDICGIGGISYTHDTHGIDGVNGTGRIGDTPRTGNAYDQTAPHITLNSTSRPTQVKWSVDTDRILFNSDYDFCINRWDVVKGKRTNKYEEHSRKIHSIDVDSKMILSGSDDTTIKLWNMEDNSSIYSIKTDASVCCVSFNKENPNLFCYGSINANIYLCDSRMPYKPFMELEGHDGTIFKVEFVNDNNLYSCSIDASIREWNIGPNREGPGKYSNSMNMTGEIPDEMPNSIPSNGMDRIYKGHENSMKSVGFAVYEDIISVGSEVNSVYFYLKGISNSAGKYCFPDVDPLTGECVSSNDDENYITDLCWLKNRPVLIGSSNNGLIEILDGI